MEFGFWILDFGFWILDFGFWILDFGFWILDFGFWILDFGFWSLDFGFWISLVFVLFVAAPNGAVWILDFGFWSLDFGFWILDFGFWSLDFGFWILDFGLDEALLDIVWILHKIFPCHADSGRRIEACPTSALGVKLLTLQAGERHKQRMQQLKKAITASKPYQDLDLCGMLGILTLWLSGWRVAGFVRKLLYDRSLH